MSDMTSPLLVLSSRKCFTSIQAHPSLLGVIISAKLHLYKSASAMGFWKFTGLQKVDLVNVLDMSFLIKENRPKGIMQPFVPSFPPSYIPIS